MQVSKYVVLSLAVKGHAKTLRRELERLDSELTLVTVTGSGAAAVGKQSVAAGERGVAAREIHGPVATGDGSEAVQAESYAEEVHLDSEQAKREEALGQYLVNLRRLCNVLPLSALSEDEGPHRRAEITLNRVYVSLNTKTQVPLSEGEKEALSQKEPFLRHAETRPLSALEAAAAVSCTLVTWDTSLSPTSWSCVLVATWPLHPTMTGGFRCSILCWRVLVRVWV